MKVFMTHKDPMFSATFTSEVCKTDSPYGNGIYLGILRNGFEFKYIDCRYMKDFDKGRYWFHIPMWSFIDIFAPTFWDEGEKNGNTN